MKCTSHPTLNANAKAAVEVMLRTASFQLYTALRHGTARYKKKKSIWRSIRRSQNGISSGRFGQLFFEPDGYWLFQKTADLTHLQDMKKFFLPIGIITNKINASNSPKKTRAYPTTYSETE
jgi:hypothetical protein